MKILDCGECQAASTCKLEQKARSLPCPSIDLGHCGDTMRLVEVDPGLQGPQMTFACLKCGARETVNTHRLPSKEKKFVDPVLKTGAKGKIPDELV